jgi:sugar-phosphatase
MRSEGRAAAAVSRWSVTADALLIDLDGTLVDSHDAIVRAWAAWADQNGVDLASVIELMPGRTAQSVITELNPDLPEHLLTRQVNEVLDQQVSDTDGVVAYPGALSLLERIPAGRWAVVTACSDRLARARLSAARLPVPEVLVGCEAASRSKPDPSGYLLAARMLSVDPDRCLVIEDSPAGCAAGRAAGATVLAVGPAAASLERLRVEQVPGCDSLLLLLT